MTPEEKFNQDVWYVLRQIKKKSLYTKIGEPVLYQIDYNIIEAREEYTSSENEAAILEKLQEQNIIKIKNREIKSIISLDNFDNFYLEIIQPKFDKLYNLYERGYKSERGEERPSLKPHASSFDWEKLSPENLKIAQKVIKITLNFLQFQPINRLALFTKMPLQKFENEQVYLDDVSGVLNRIDGVKVINTELHYQIKEYKRTMVVIPSTNEVELPDYLPSKEELKNYVFLRISSSDELHRVQGLIDKKLKIDMLSIVRIQTKQEPAKFIVSVKDREIWVNEYLIGKPHAVGSNFEFFDHIRSQAPHTKINRDELPSKYGSLSIKEQVENKSFIKILNGLGFKGEILKAFFYKRGKDTLIYRGDEITKENLIEAGVKITLFLKELELAHTKNSPE